MAKQEAAADEMVSLKAKGTEMGSIEIVRPSKLEAEGVTGTVAEGIFEKAEPNKFDATKKDYFIRSKSNTLYILNETKALKDQLGQEGVVGMYVKVNYEGKVETKNKKGFHNFTVLARKAKPTDVPATK